MAGWRDSLDDDSTVAAAPGGLQQQTVVNTPTGQEPYTGQNPAQVRPGSGWRNSVFEQGDTRNQPRWQSGGQRGTLDNAWDTAFTQKMFQQRDEAEASGNLGDLPNRDDYTGIVLWDQSSSREDRDDYKLGDVYRDGQFLGNLLDPDEGYDPTTAYSLLAQYTLDADTQAKAFERLEYDPDAVKKEVRAKAEQNAKQYPAFESQQRFQGEVTALKKNWDDAAEMAASIGGGAVASGLTVGGLGAMIGTAVGGPVGTAVGGAAGFLGGAIAGAIGGWLNKDQLVDAAARASVMTGRAAADEADGGEGKGLWGGVSTGLRQWGQVSMMASSPLQNIYQGAVDAATPGGVGDDVSGFYDPEERAARDEGWQFLMESVNTATLLGDSLIQFASPFGRSVTAAIMGSQAVGGVGQITPILGTGLFDDRSGTFDAPDNLVEAASAVAVVGIDAVQLGMLRSLTRAGQNLTAQATRGVDENSLWRKLAKQDALQQQTVGARTFRGPEGQRTVKTNWVQLMAPSEAVQWLSVRGQALRDGARGVAITPDDLYAASLKLASGSSPVKAHLLNALGEGAEEFIQTGLEPVAHGWDFDLEGAVAAAWAGAAAGAGFSVGSRVGQMTQVEVDLYRVNDLRSKAGLEKIPAKDWRRFSSEDRAVELVRGRLLDEAASEVTMSLVEENRAVQVDSDVLREVVNDNKRVIAAQEAKKLNEYLERTWLLTLTENAYVPQHVVQGSGETIKTVLESLLKGFDDAARGKTVEEIATALGVKNAKRAARKKPPIPLTADQQADAALLRDTLAGFLNGVGGQPGLLQKFTDLQVAVTVNRREEIVKEINQALQAAWHETDTPLARAVGAVFARDPRDNSGSFQLMLPQISFSTHERGGDGIIQVGSGALKALTADFDGDQLRLAARMVLNKDNWVHARVGDNIRTLQAEGAADLAIHATEAQNIELAGRLVAKRGTDEQFFNLAWARISKRLFDAYGQVPGIRDAMRTLKKNLRNGVTTAKESFLDELLSHDETRDISIRGNKVIAPYTHTAWFVQDVIHQELQTMRRDSASVKQIVLDRREAPDLPVADVKPRRTRGAATPGRDRALSSPGNDPLRQSMSLQYGKERSAAAHTQFGTESDRQWMIQWYTQLTSGTSLSALEEVYASDMVTRTALQMLTELRKQVAREHPNTPITLGTVAGLWVPNIDRTGHDHGGMIPAITAVLRDAVVQLETQDSRLIEARPELATKYSVYKNMSVADAYIEVFGALPVREVLPKHQADLVGPNLTVAESNALYFNQNFAGRRAWRKKYRAPETGYGEGAVHDLPYGIEEVISGDVNEYRIFIDAITDSSGNRLTGHADGTVTGSLAKRDAQDIAGLAKSFKNVYRFLTEQAALYGFTAKKGERLSPQLIAKLLDSKPELARVVYGNLDPQVANVVFSAQEDGTTIVRRWFFDVLVEPNSDKAVLTFFRQQFLARMNVAVGNPKASKRPDDRLVNLAIELSNDPVGDRYGKFKELLGKATSVEHFMREVNKLFVHNEAPMLAFTRDVAMIDPTETRGGWSQVLPSVEQRENYQRLLRKSSKLFNEMEDAARVRRVDDVTMAHLREALRDPNSLSRPMLDRLEFYLAAARQIVSQGSGGFAGAATYGPAAVQRAALAGIFNFTGSEADKAASAPEVSPLGAHTATGFAPLWAEGLEQQYAAYTSYDAQDVARQPQALIEPMEIMNGRGGTIHWPGLTAESFVKMWEQPQLQSMLLAIVFPSAWELNPQTNQLEQKLLVGASLTELLNGDVYSRIQKGNSYRDKALYAAAIDGIAQKHGGNAPLARWAMDLVIDRTNAARHPVDEYTARQWYEEALGLVVDLTRMSASLPAQLRKEAFKEAKPKKKFGEEAESISKAHGNLVRAIREAILLPYVVAVNETKENSVDRAIAEDRLREAEEFINGTDQVSSVILSNTIAWDSPGAAASKKRYLYEYITRHKSLPSISGNKDGEYVRQALSRSKNVGASGFPQIHTDPKEDRKAWDAVSRAVSQHQLADMYGTASAVFTEAAIPSGDMGKYLHYWDSSGMYRLQTLMEEGSPALAAAEEFNRLTSVGPITGHTRKSELVRTIETQLFQEHLVPKWNPALAGDHVAAQVKFDISGADPQIRRAGQLFESQKAITGATKYTRKNPPDSMARTYQFSIVDLTRDDLPIDHQLIDLNPTAAGPRSIPAALLNGRYTVSVKLVYDGGEVDLLDGPPSVRAGKKGAHGRRVTSLRMLRRAIEANPVPKTAKNTRLEISFFHPEDLPPGKEWSNNIIFDGVLPEHAAAPQVSLNADQTFAPGGRNQTGQRQAMDAIKKAALAIRNAFTPTAAEAKALSELPTFQQMLEGKVLDLLPRESGSGSTDAETFAAILKRFKLQHTVRGIIEQDGQRRVVVLTAEEVIRQQAGDPTVALTFEGIPLENPELQLLSGRVLRTLLGDEGPMSVGRSITKVPSVDITNWGAWTGTVDQARWQKLMPDMYALDPATGSYQEFTLENTPIAQRESLSQFSIRPALSVADVSRMSDRKAAWERVIDKITASRRNRNDAEQARQERNVIRGLEAIMADGTMQSILPKKTIESLGLSKAQKMTDNKDVRRIFKTMSQQDVVDELVFDNGRTIWQYAYDGRGGGSRADGYLNGPAALDQRHEHDEAGGNIAPRDVVIVNLGEFVKYAAPTAIRRELTEVLKKLTDQGSVVIFTDTSGQAGDWREAGREILAEMLYENVPGSAGVYRPVWDGGEFQNERARMSKQLEIELVYRDNLSVIAQIEGIHGFENVSLSNPKASASGREFLVQRNLVPSSHYPFFSYPKGSDHAQTVIDAIERMNTVEGRLHLARLAAKVDKDKKPDLAARSLELEAALTRAARIINPKTGLPKEGENLQRGDLIGLVNPAGKVVFYRHGFEPIPHEDALNEALDTDFQGAPGGIAIYGSKPLPVATTHSGRIASWEPKNLYGLSVIEWIPLSDLGKFLTEGSGHKDVTIPMEGTGYEMPDFAILGDLHIEKLKQLADSIGKEDHVGVLSNAREATAYLGTDFAPLYAEAFFGISRRRWDSMAADEQETYRNRASDVLLMAQRSLHGSVLDPQTLSRVIRSTVNAATDVSDYFDSILQSSEKEALGADFTWLGGDSAAVAHRVAQAAILYMAAPGARPEHIMTVAGIKNKTTPGHASSFKPPALFMDIFDNNSDDDLLDAWYFGELNLRLNNDSRLDQGYHLTNRWILQIKTPTGEVLEGRLQFAEQYTSGANSVMVTQAQEGNVGGKEGASAQQSAIAQQAFWGAPAGQAKKMKKTQRYIDREGITDINKPEDLIKVMNGTGAVSPRVGPKMSQATTPAERVAQDRGQRSVDALDRRIDKSLMTEEEWADIVSDRDQVAGLLNLTGAEKYFVDYWMRRILARPKLKNPKSPAEEGRIYYSDAKQALALMRENVRAHRYPTWGAAIPAMSARELRVLYNANQGESGWHPNSVTGRRKAEGPKSWDQWYMIALGEMRSSQGKAALMFLEAMDGYLQTYKGQSDVLEDLPISLSDLKSANLLDPVTNQVVVSFDPDQVQRLKDAPLFNADSADIDALFNGQTYADHTSPLSAQGLTVRNLSAWHKKVKAPLDNSSSVGDMEARGRSWHKEGATTSGFLRGMLLLRIGQGMAHPALMAFAPLEMFYRGIIRESGALLSGESTSKFGQLQSMVQDRVAKSTLANTPLGRALGLNVQPRFTPKTQAHIQRVISQMQSLPEFKHLINSSLFEYEIEPWAGRIERKLHSAVSVLGRMQDPVRDMGQRQAATAYVNAVAMYYAQTGAAVDLDTVLTDFSRNSDSIRKVSPAAHQFGVRAVENLRSIKKTGASLVAGGIMDSLANNQRSRIINASGMLFGKIPYAFQNFGFNLLTNITGAQGLDAMFSLALQGRSNGRSWGKVQAWLSGESESYDPDRHGVDFLGQTMESVDFADAFIRSGMTHTGLLALALAMGNLGLDGEDEEDKRRRRAEEMQGSGHVYDPRELQNDWRNADAIWLDNIEGLNAFFQVVDPATGETSSPAQLHWILKQFLSPALGISQFAKTGNWRHVQWGFEDAVGSMPLVNTMLYDDAMKTSNELFQLADDATLNGNPENLPEAASFLMSGVWRLERMLFENAFLNAVYIAMDRYDRDPSIRVDLSAEGKIERNDLNQPMNADVLAQHMDAEGETGEHYSKYSESERTIRSFAENRATLAIFGSLVTGFVGGDSLLRQDMAVRTHSIEKNALSDAEAEQLVLSMWDPENERETLTDAGREAIIWGLHKGTVRPGDPALANIYMTGDQRYEVMKSLMARILQEGYDAGLGEEAAEARLRRLVYGDSSNPYAIPLASVIWGEGKFEDAIGWEERIDYRQLNTSYITGPDGYPWATGISRDGLESMWGLAPLTRYGAGGNGALPVDSRLNSVDPTANINTGLRQLERVHPSEKNVTQEDILKALDEGFKEVTDAIKAPSWSDENGWQNWGRGYGGGGGGGGGYAYRLNSPVRNDPTYGRNIPYVNVDNPLLRRATIRRERFSSTRGRLNQWQ